MVTSMWPSYIGIECSCSSSKIINFCKLTNFILSKEIIKVHFLFYFQIKCFKLLYISTVQYCLWYLTMETEFIWEYAYTGIKTPKGIHNNSERLLQTCILFPIGSDNVFLMKSWTSANCLQARIFFLNSTADCGITGSVIMDAVSPQYLFAV